MSKVYFHYRQQAASLNLMGQQRGAEQRALGSREKQERMQGFEKKHLVSTKKQAKIQVVEISK